MSLIKQKSKSRRSRRRQRKLDVAHTPLGEHRGVDNVRAWKQIFKGIHTVRSVQTIATQHGSLSKQKSNKRGGKTTSKTKRAERGWGPLT